MDSARSNGKAYQTHVPECDIQKRLSDPRFVGSHDWWQRYAVEHVWAAARRLKLAATKLCEQCGREGRPPFAELRKLEPAHPFEKNWIIARETLFRNWVLTVVHVIPDHTNLYANGCSHHADNLRVLCMRCYQASDYFPVCSTRLER